MHTRLVHSALTVFHKRICDTECFCDLAEEYFDSIDERELEMFLATGETPTVEDMLKWK